MTVEPESSELRGRIARGEALPEVLGAALEGEIARRAGSERRRQGAHYTPYAITREVVSRCLAPLLEGIRTPDEVLALRVCDPAMGAGYFLLAACRALAEKLLDLWGSDAQPREALRRVARGCLYGVDLDPQAVRVARESLGLLCGDPEVENELLARLCVGDSLVDARRVPARVSVAPLALREAFSEVFERENPGFDAVLGNPPWIAYAGRAAQPLSLDRRRWFLRHNPAFHGYRTAHGMFTWRAAEILRRGGRLGLVLPTSVSDLEGYGPTRAAHDALCACDPWLPDFGSEAFEGVFQPAMALLSTRRETEVRPNKGCWELAREDLSGEDQSLLARLSALPTMAAGLFRERGFHTIPADRGHMRVRDGGAGWVSLREGADIRAFARCAPRLAIDTGFTGARLSARGRWEEVSVLVRQTARFPIAALSDGGAFRNSLLAVIAGEGWTRGMLLGWLNSSPLRWFHYQRQRDARQGMPQVKIGHLRGLPAPGGSLGELGDFAEGLGARNTGITEGEQRRLDALAADALGLGEAERALIGRWRLRVKG